MRNLTIVLLVLLTLAHHDFWWWNSDRVVLGFLPVGLAYHAGVSLAAGVLWAMAVRFCWPQGVDHVDASTESGSNEGGAA